jgi:hypothetical protein
VLGDVLDQFAESLVAGDEVRLAVHFQQHAELAAVVNVAGDAAFLGGAQGFLAGDSDALLAKDLFGLGRSPPASCNACLQSIMPAPVFRGEF